MYHKLRLRLFLQVFNLTTSDGTSREKDQNTKHLCMATAQRIIVVSAVMTTALFAVTFGTLHVLTTPITFVVLLAFRPPASADIIG
jgi:lipopolysaccharide export LptBFGC system permease protein LptF